MKKRLSKKQMFFNKVKFTKDDDLCVGIDVHKESYVAKGLLRPVAIPTGQQEQGHNSNGKTLGHSPLENALRQ